MRTSAISARLADREVCDDLLVARLERPEAYAFEAGQWLRLTLETAEGEQTKTFSIASGPHDEELVLATRLSGSAFKNALASLPVGSDVEVSPPGGRLRLPRAERLAFLVGGVGITPFRSMLRDVNAEGIRLSDAVLLFGNEEARCEPFLDELTELGPRIGLRVVPVYDQPPDDWPGERGFITAEMVLRHAEPIDDRIFLTAGPPSMVTAMEGVLDELGVDTGRRVVERFGAPRE